MSWMWVLTWMDSDSWLWLAIVVLLTVFWMVQLVVLMRMRGEAFPWQFDKALWFVAVFFGFFLGALAFLIWRKLREAEAKVLRDVAANVNAQRRAAASDQTPPQPPAS